MLFLVGLLLPLALMDILPGPIKAQYAFILQYALSAFQEIFMIGLPALLIYLAYYGKQELFSQLMLPDSYQAGLATISAVSFTLAGSLLVIFWLAFLTSFGYTPFVPVLLDPEKPIEYLMAFLLAALIPAISEELLFRGVILRYINNMRGEKAAILLTAFLFAVLHLSIEGVPALVVIGAVLAKVALKYNNLTLPILFHTVYNIAAILINASGATPSLNMMLVCVAVFVVSTRALLQGTIREES